MPELVLLAIFAFLISPFALSGYRRAWRGAVAVWFVLALYTAYVWTLRLPPYFDEQDRLGADAWRGMLAVLTTGSALTFAVGFAVSAILARRHRNQAKEAVK